MIRPPAPRRSGFTLIELLAVMLIIGILATFLFPQIPKALDRANVTACMANMKAIGEGLNAYHAQFGHLPREGGARFHTSLISDEVWEATEANAKRLTCPAIDTGSLLGLAGMEPEEYYVDEDAIDGSFTAYAARDMRDHPIRKYPVSGKEVLVADDNDPDGNHRTTTVVLMGDYSTKQFELVEYKDKGLVARDETFLVVGPGSPIEVLQMLSLD